MSDLISRQAAIDALCSECQGQCIPCESYPCSEVEAINALPSAQSEQTDCDYCHEDSDGYVKPIEKNCHAVIFGSVLYLKAEGWRGEVEIKYCPMCGRRLER